MTARIAPPTVGAARRLAGDTFPARLVELLTAEQRQRKWKDYAMARTLGIGRAHWNDVRNRRVAAGPKVQRGAEAAFPDLCLAARWNRRQSG